jgi:DNA-binding transcriptional LysR family regulator
MTTNSKLAAKLGTLRQMEIFLAVAHEQSLAKAAKKLHITQPTVSIQVRKLAEAVGEPLYEVIGKKLKLTSVGNEVVLAGKEIFETIGRLDDKLNNIRGLQAGNLRIAVVSTAKYFVPYVLAPFCELYPGIDVELNVGTRQEIIQRLDNNLDDLYIFSELPENVDISCYPFLPNPIAVIASKDNLLTKRRKLTWDDLAEQKFIMREEGSGSLYTVQKHLEKHGLRLPKAMNIQSNEAIKHAVMANMGICILSAHMLVNADTDGLAQLKVEHFPILSQWQIVHLSQKRLSTVATAFLDFMLREGKDHLPMDRIKANVLSAQKGVW